MGLQQSGPIPGGWPLAWFAELPADAPPARLVVLVSALLLVGIAALITLIVHFRPRTGQWARQWARLRRRPWYLHDVGWLLAVLLCLQAAAVLALSGFRRLLSWEADHLPFVWITLHSLALHGACLPLVWVLLRRKGRSWIAAFCPTPLSGGHAIAQGIGLYLAALPPFVLITALYHAGLQAVGYTPMPQDVVQLFALLEYHWMRVYFVILAVIVAPIAEEILFRGILLPAAAKWCRAAGAIAITTILFALLHLHLPSLIPLAFLSLVLSLAYVYTGSIIVPIVMHMIFNAISLLTLTWLG